MIQITINVTAGGIEKLVDTHRISDDPGAGTLTYGVVTAGAATAPVSWVAGTVGGETAWAAGTERVEHLTPTLGAAGAGIVLTAGTRYDLYAKLVLAGETFVRHVGRLRAV